MCVGCRPIQGRSLSLPSSDDVNRSRSTSGSAGSNYSVEVCPTVMCNPPSIADKWQGNTWQYMAIHGNTWQYIIILIEINSFIHSFNAGQCTGTCIIIHKQ